MKKIFISVLLLALLAVGAFAQTNDSYLVLQRKVGVEKISDAVYHVEVLKQKTITVDISAHLEKISQLQGFGPIAFLMHGKNGYVVAVYASKTWEPEFLSIPDVFERVDTVATDNLRELRNVIDSGEFTKHITRKSFLQDIKDVLGNF
jgi:hypothetical protein